MSPCFPIISDCGLVRVRKDDVRNIDVSPPQNTLIEKDATLGEDDLLDHPSEGDVCERVSTIIRDRSAYE